jgi:hypothetical protein
MHHPTRSLHGTQGARAVFAIITGKNEPKWHPAGVRTSYAAIRPPPVARTLNGALEGPDGNFELANLAVMMDNPADQSYPCGNPVSRCPRMADEAPQNVQFSLAICTMEKDGQISYEFVLKRPDSEQDGGQRRIYNTLHEVRSALTSLCISHHEIDKAVHTVQLDGFWKLDELEMERYKLVLLLFAI